MQSYFSGGASVRIDTSELDSAIRELSLVLSRDELGRLTERTFREIARKAKTLVAREVVQDYAVPQYWVKRGIGNYKIGGGGASVRCEIPLMSVKGTIGGRYRAYTLKNRRISAKILKRDGRSHLPEKMNNQGGHPPFIATGAGNGVAFTRRTKRRLPIVRVVGLGVPQMPLNLSADKVQDSLLDYGAQRLEHNFYHMFGKGGK